MVLVCQVPCQKKTLPEPYEKRIARNHCLNHMGLGILLRWSKGLGVSRRRSQGEAAKLQASKFKIRFWGCFRL